MHSEAVCSYRICYECLTVEPFEPFALSNSYGEQLRVAINFVEWWGIFVVNIIRSKNANAIIAYLEEQYEQLDADHNIIIESAAQTSGAIAVQTLSNFSDNNETTEDNCKPSQSSVANRNFVISFEAL